MSVFLKKRYWRRCNNSGLFGESGYWQLGSQGRLQTSDPAKMSLESDGKTKQGQAG